jgi:6-phosphogluconate dehydrogenase
VDTEGTFHTEWGGDRSETPVGGSFKEDKSAHTDEKKVDQPIS